MSKVNLKGLVEEGARLDAELKVKGERLREIKSILAEHFGVKGGEAEAGKARVKVIFPASSIGRVEDEAQLSQVKRIAGKAFEKLFAPIWSPVKSFREVAKAVLGGKAAEDLTKLLEKPAAPRVTFEVAE